MVGSESSKHSGKATAIVERALIMEKALASVSEVEKNINSRKITNP